MSRLICSRLHMAIVGGMLIPVGLWWFAWYGTSFSSVFRLNDPTSL